MKVPVLLACSIFLTQPGCSTTSPLMPVSGGAYTVSKSGKTGFTSLGKLRKQAYDEANRFAAAKGKVAEVVSVNEVPAGFARWPQVDLKFRLIDSSEIGSSKTPSLSIDSAAGYDAMGRVNDASIRVNTADDKEVYDALKKLGDLKDRGLITEKEFQAEKERLLRRN